MAESFLSSLITSANTLKQEQQDRQRKITDTYNSKVTASNIFSRQRSTQAQFTTGNTVIKPRNKPLVEPNLAYEKNSVGAMSNLLKLAKDYGTNKPQQINAAAGYLNSLSSTNLNTVQQAKTGVFNASMDNYNKALAQWNAAPAFTRDRWGRRIFKSPFNMVKPTENDSWYSNPTVSNNRFDFNKPLTDLRNSYANTKVYRDMLSAQSTQLQDLNKNQESIFGAGFSKVDAQTLQAANWTGVKGLQAEIEKYKSLRDIYADKYAKDQSATNLSYLKSYNTLVYDASKSMADETTRTLISAKNTAVLDEQTKQTTISTLENYNKLFKDNENNTQKQKASVESRKPIDVNVNTTKKLIENRVNTVSNYTTKKSSPTFESRPI